MSGKHNTFWRYLLFPIWKFIVGGPPFVYGWFAFIRDEFLPSETADRLRIGGFINIVNWYWWVIGGVIILWIITVWDAAKRTSEIENMGLNKPLETKTDYRQNHTGSGDNQIGDRYYFVSADKKKR